MVFAFKSEKPLLLCGAELDGVDAGRGFRAEMSAPLEVLRCWGLTARG